MRIKKLEIIGFKSFKDRTVIHFDAGITGIVGPNGCGKSNIVDALTWVMGEMSAKHLRGSSMEDVIFAGAEGFAPLGMCEVSLTLENDGGPFPVQYLKFSEIMVTRRLHRSGESEYFINREPARLRDIQEIFMDTGAGSKGFSIIQQNAIGQMITAKPEDRRMLIEEAAGITKFKVRKRESQRKLVSTEQNLVRILDIVGELKRQMDSLERQAQRAERYRNLKNEIEDLDVWLSSRQYLEIHDKMGESQAAFEAAQAEEAQSSAQTASREALLQEKRVLVTQLESQVSLAQGEQGMLRTQAQEHETQIQELRFEIEQARRNKEMTGSMVQENEMRRGLLQSDLDRVLAQLAVIRTEAEELAKEFALQKEIYEQSSSRIEEVDTELSQARREMLSVSQAESHLTARVAALNESMTLIGEAEAEAQALLTELLEKRGEFEGRKKRVWGDFERERQMQLDLQNDVESFEANRQALQRQINERRDEVDLFKDSLNEVTSRLYGLENLANNFEGFQEGVKSVMFWQKSRLDTLSDHERESATQFQPVSEVVEVPAELELAMEAALGPRLQMLLSSDADTAMSAVSYLKAQKSGRSSFVAGGLMGEVMTDQDRIPGGANVVAILQDVVRAPEKHAELVKGLLNKVAVVDSLDSAISLRSMYKDWTFVTTEGDLLSHDGIITGGTAESADSGMLKRRREIKELTQKKDEWSGKLALAQVTLKKMEESLARLVSDLEQAQKRNTEKEILLASIKKDMERAEQELNNAQTAISRQERELMDLSQKLASKKAEVEDHEQRLAGFTEKREALEERSAELAEELLVAKSGIDELQARVTDLQVRSATRKQECEGLDRQAEMLGRSLAEVTSVLTRMSEESTRSTETMSSHQIMLEERRVTLDRLIHEISEADARVGQLRNTYEVEHAFVREMEQELSSVLTRKNQLQMTMNEAQLHVEQMRMRETYLIEQMRERYMVDLSAVAESYRARTEEARLKSGDGGDAVAESEARLKDLKEKISRIGEVNLAAIEEYEEVSKRYEFLSQQQKDLVDAKEQLKKVIDRINRICSKRFKDTFEQVNERFTKVFPVLFGGGEAKLVLVEDPEKGEMGIDIHSSPPGKKLQSVTLLSGGEKALTAVALIFSIFLVKPSPYCLLDEVDAPLDDANVFRFNDLVREMAKRSQIIVVTHNKYTMEVASKLYGVTMQDKGVSKMVSVNLDDAKGVAVGADIPLGAGKGSDKGAGSRSKSSGQMQSRGDALADVAAAADEADRVSAAATEAAERGADVHGTTEHKVVAQDDGHSASEREVVAQDDGHHADAAQEEAYQVVVHADVAHEDAPHGAVSDDLISEI